MFFFKNGGIFGLVKADRVLIGFCLICILLCGSVFLNERFFQAVFGTRVEDTSRPLLGQISLLENDTRHKNPNSFVWEKAFRDQNIRLNDSVFTGALSSAQVHLNKGQQVKMGPNTMIYFRELDGLNLPDLTTGNFRFVVDGSVTLAVQGRVLKIEGHASEVQIYLGNDQKPQMRVLKGRVSIYEKNLPVKMMSANEYGGFGRLPASHKPQSVTPEGSPLVLAPQSGEVLSQATLRLYDLFEVVEGGLKKKTQAPGLLRVERSLQWRVLRGSENQVGVPVRIQMAPVSDFSHSVRSFQVKENSILLKQAFAGDNFWRVSIDGRNWSENLKFQVEEKDLTDSVRLYRAQQGALVLSSGSVTTSLQVQTSADMRGYVLESSLSPEFPEDATQAYWMGSHVIGLTFKRSGRFYYRVRGVNSSFELTVPSNTEEVIVAPPLPLRLAVRSASRRQALESKEARLKAVGGVFKQETLQPDQLVPSDQELSVKEVDRLPTSMSTSAVKASDVEVGPLNQGYLSSKLAFESGAFTVYSPDESDIGRKTPMAMSMGLRSHHWFGESGLEASVKMKAADANETAKGINPLMLEARYLYLIRPEFMGRTQTVIIGGYEIYRNLGRGYFSQKYNLAKVGLSFDFPVRSRWDMGGEALFGLGDDSSKKYELAGRMNYYIRKDWSFGVGYRFYLFEAGSRSSAPLEVPYKEAFGEGYSVLRWHY